MNHEDKEKIISAINESKCTFASCRIQGTLEASLPVVQRFPDGRIKPFPEMYAKGGFCLYHATIARQCCAWAVKDDQDTKGELLGPFEAINIIEAVLQAKDAWTLANPGVPLPQAGLTKDLSSETQ